MRGTSRNCLVTVKVLLLFFLTSCSNQNSQLQDGTKEMVALLDSIANNINPKTNIYANHKRLQYLKNLPEPEYLVEKIQHEVNLGRELLYSGESEEAIKKLNSILTEIESLKSSQPFYYAQYAENVVNLLAISWLRLGEQQNCIINHTSDSCLFPIRKSGIHSLPNGSEKAIELYTRILQEWESNDMTARWLLNIAYMTIGKHPDEVPEQWLIPNEAFRSEYKIQRFQDIAKSAGLADDMSLLGGSITEDFNRDGYIDIMYSSWGLDDQLEFYLNNGDGTFTKKTNEAGLKGIVGGINVIQGDFLNNGQADVYVMRGAWLGDTGKHPNSLLRNNGDGTFSDVTKSSGLLSFHPTLSAVWSDLNNDGWLDLFVGNETGQTGAYPAELYINNKNGTFTNIARQSNANITGNIKGVTVGDYNNDGFQDIYISRLNDYNILLKNKGTDPNGLPQFTDVTQHAEVAEPLKSFPVWFWDYNNDGWLDLFVSGYKATSGVIAKEFLNKSHDGEIPRLYKNNGDGTFTNVSKKVGLDKILYSMGSNFGDLNNNGYPDFYVGTGDPDYQSLMPNRMFRNRNGEYFEEVTTSGGFGHLQKGHGVSFSDLNNNGNQDIFTVIGGAFEGDVYMNSLFHNPGNSNQWITLIFDGQESNHFGIGNRIKIDVETPEGPRTIHKVVSTGGSFGSSSLQQEIGLGNATKLIELEVFWPASGKKQIFEDVTMKQFYTVSENSNQLERVERTHFDFITNSIHAEELPHHY